MMRPFLWRFASVLAQSSDDQTLIESEYESSPDGREPSKKDYADDEDDDGGKKTGLLEDSNVKEDEDV